MNVYSVAMGQKNHVSIVELGAHVGRESPPNSTASKFRGVYIISREEQKFDQLRKILGGQNIPCGFAQIFLGDLLGSDEQGSQSGSLPAQAISELDLVCSTKIPPETLRKLEEIMKRRGKEAEKAVKAAAEEIFRQPHVNEALQGLTNEEVHDAEQPHYLIFYKPVGGRGDLLSQKIQEHDTVRRNNIELARSLDRQINDRGGEAYAGVALLSQRDTALKKAERNKRIVDALTIEKQLHHRYETEICTFTTIRVGLATMQEDKSVRNADVLALADKVYPSLFDEKSILLGLLPSHLASKFKGEASIDDEITRLEKVSSASPETELLRLHLSNLYAVKQAKLERDRPYDNPFSFSSPDIDLPQFSDSAISVSDIKIDEWYSRISCYRMPSNAEQGTNDAVVLHEIYPSDTAQMVCLAIVYYKRWHLGQFNLSGESELVNDLLQLRSRLCELCKKELGKETSSFRLPSCMQFLRFYDETELLEDQVQPTQVHIPLCEALDSGTLTDDHENILQETGKLYRCSVPDLAFGELFKRQMLGSNWIERVYLQGIYKVLKADLPESVKFVTHWQLHKSEPKE